LPRAFNCAGCHGARGGGGIGPPFADAEWIYGGEPQNVFQSVVQGRPAGMPAFGGQIPDEQVWKIVAFVRSLAGGPESAGADDES
jgi:cytochrome c oxidase cbb3-type subunit 3